MTTRQRSAARIAATKLQPPPARSDHLPRERLVGMLAGDEARRLTLLAAPAGSGKTSLLVAWRAWPDESRPFAWVTVDEGDDDPVRFWTCVLEALDAVRPGLGARAGAALRSPGVGIVDGMVPVLVDELAGLRRPIVLVLDDYQLVSAPEVHESVRALLDQAPATLHVALASRSDPPFPLARLRVRGELTEIRAGDLRFTPTEAERLLNDVLGLELATSDAQRLTERTEGWAAGLQLAAASLRSQDDPAEFVATFAGDDRHVVDYLVLEVLDGLPDSRREFLQRTSILDRLSGPLCDAVLETDGSDAILPELERENLFVVALDDKRRWYRYHHMFRDLLRDALDRHEPVLAKALHRRAAVWHRDHGLDSEAVGHFTAAGDLAAARELITLHWYDLLQHGRLATVQAWIDGLGPQAVIGDPDLCLIKAWAAINTGRLDELDRWIAAAERAAPEVERDPATPPLEAGVASLRAIHRYMVGDVGEAVQAGRYALKVEGGGAASPWRPVGCPVLGLSLFWRRETDDARVTLESAVEEARRDGNNLAEMHATGGLAAIELEDGAFDEASRRAEDALRLARERGLSEHWAGALAHVARGETLSRIGRHDEAVTSLERGVALARRGIASVEAGYALALLAGARRAAGESADARELDAEARYVVATCADPGRLRDVVERTAGTVTSSQRRRPPASVPDDLSDRELAVLRLLTSPLSQREIGAELYVSLNTVKSHTKSIYRKLGAATRDEAVERARDLQLI